MSLNLFTYGTLMFPEVWKRIHIGEFPAVPATLRGFAIYRVRDAVFPGIVRADDTKQVTGRVYLNLDEDTLFELDAYESDLYERINVTATLEDGTELACYAFVVPDSHRQALTDEPWDATQFEQQELQKYLHG
ncbi:MAG: gamma-glutamylcyclotransferase [Pirellulales bacterium]|nr:gamma-glutamylcyclotransferase [Pirellulales bacterium]